MARITLRDYNNEINDLIDHGQIEEAISHCRHILKEFPKYVDTYRLLGKAYLEQQRYGDAADILQRVLSSIPDDFISQIGMSIIREDEMNLDAAIYHMELAFESQPSNHAIQDELRRLFAKRDGMEPPRIRLTRGALARMYAHGHLVEQAISEIQAALSEDPKRYDLQTLLAEMLYQADKKVDAAETCTRILEKLPFNMGANRLLATILKESKREDEAKRFQQRWEALDPYAAFISGLAANSDQVSDDAVTIEHQDWEPVYGGALGGEQPIWASSEGVSTEGEEPPEDIPEWLSSPEGQYSDFPEPEQSPLIESSESDWMTEEAGSSESPFGSPDISAEADDWMAEFSPPPPPKTEDQSDDWMAEFASQPEPAGEDLVEDIAGEASPDEATPVDSSEAEIPGFLKEAGWEESTGEATSEPVVGFDEPDERVEEGEIPEWIKDMAPPEAEAPPTPDLGAMKDIKAEPDPDWLKSVGEGQIESQPDWLDELGENVAEDKEAGPVSSREVDPAGYLAGDFGDDDTDDWLASFSAEGPIEPKEEPEETPEKAARDLAGDFGDDTEDWLSSLSAAQSTTPVDEPELTPDKAAPDLVGDFGEDDTEEWLSSLSAAQPTGTAGEPEETPEKAAGYLAGDFGDDDTDDWLSSLSAAQPAGTVDEPTETPEKGAGDFAEDFGEDDTDEWLSSLAAEQQAAESADAIEAASEEAGIDLPGDFDKDDTDDWLSSLSAELPDDGLEDMEGDEEIAKIDAVKTDSQPLVTEVVPTAPAEPRDMEDEGLAWLESLAAKQGVDEEELVTTPDERQPFEDDHTPTWLTSQEGGEAKIEEPNFAELLGEVEPSTPPQAPIAGDAILEEEDDLSMDWLDSISKEAAAEAASDEEPSPEPPILEQLPETPSDELSDLFAVDTDEAQTTQDWLAEQGEQAQEQKPSIEPSQVEGTVFEEEDDFSMDWLDSISKEAAAQATAEAEFPAGSGDDLSTFMEPEPGAEAEQDGEQALDWLEQLSGETEVGVQPETDDLRGLFAEPDEAEPISQPFDEVPSDKETEQSLDWLEDLGQETDLLVDAAETIPDSAPLDVILGISIEEEELSPPREQEPQVKEEASRTDDTEDEGLAWLESLAAKQGVAEEELVTTPDERSSFDDERTPDWLKQAEEDQPDKELSQQTDLDDLDDLDSLLDEVEEIADAAPPPEIEPVFEEDDDFSMDWLDSISEEAAAEALEGEKEEFADAEDSASTGELPELHGDLSSKISPISDFTEAEFEPLEEQMAGDELELPEAVESTFEEDIEPEWLKIIQEEKSPKSSAEVFPESLPEEEEIARTLEGPKFTGEQPTPEETREEAILTAPEDVLEDQDDFSMDWLDSISQEAAAEAGVDLEQEPLESIEEPVEAEKIPDWLATIEEDATAPDEGLEELGEIFGIEHDIPVDPTDAEAQPTAVPEWLQEIADEKPSAEPSAEPEWLPEIREPETEPDIQPAQAQDWQPAVEAEDVPVQSTAEQPAAVPEPSEALLAVKQAIQSGKLEEAIKKTNTMIKKGKELDELIDEIKQALRYHPVNVELWQVLGDAYMKQNNLQDALDAYSKAEELLR